MTRNNLINVTKRNWEYNAGSQHAFDALQRVNNLETHCSPLLFRFGPRIEETPLDHQGNNKRNGPSSNEKTQFPSTESLKYYSGRPCSLIKRNF